MSIEKKEFFAPAIPTMRELGLSPEKIQQEITFARQIILGNYKLQKCDPQSVIDAIINVAAIDMTLNPDNPECYLIPYGKVCKLSPRYTGYKNKLLESGDIVMITIQLLYEKDVVKKFVLSENKKPIVVETYRKGDRGEILGVYGIATMKQGYEQAEWMPLKEVYEKARDRSMSWKNDPSKSPWTMDEGEMIRKSLMRRFRKWLKEGKTRDQLAKAELLDMEDYEMTPEQNEYIESLLHTANIRQEEKEKIHRSMDGFSFAKAKKCIDYLQSHQLEDVDRSTQGYSVEGDVKKN